MSPRLRKHLAAATALLSAAGCVANRPTGPATRRATDADPATTQPTYWLEQPAVGEVVGRDYAQLWQACEVTSRRWLFPVDHRDFRAGVLTTEPVVSRQFFEPWRRDGLTAADVGESSLAQIRRTVRWEFARNDDGSYAAVPKVLVERLASVEQKLRPTTRDSNYWYPLRRDTLMEQRLAESARSELSRPK